MLFLMLLKFFLNQDSLVKLGQPSRHDARGANYSIKDYTDRPFEVSIVHINIEQII